MTQVLGWKYCDDDSVHQLYAQKIKVSSRKARRKISVFVSLDFPLKCDGLSGESRITGRGKSTTAAGGGIAWRWNIDGPQMDRCPKEIGIYEWDWSYIRSNT